MEELNLNQIQSETMRVLLKIDEICKNEHFDYVLTYGTLIGAVRHHGFIPWDDDLDIWMTREHFDKFVEYCLNHEEEIKPFKLCTRASVKNYSYNIPRLSNMNYRYVNTDKHQNQFDIGTFVDIYPIDNYGNSTDDAKKILRKCDRQNMFYDIYINPNSRKNAINTFAKKIVNRCLHLVYGDTYYIHAEKNYRKYITKYSSKDSIYVGCPCWTLQFNVYRRDKLFDHNGFFKKIYCDFNGVKLPIPEGYDEILTDIYGDYMQLPPENKRIPHHDYKIYKIE